MSRLVESDIRDIEEAIAVYDVHFKGQTGYIMEEIAKKAADLQKPSKAYKVAVISVTSGQGMITGFAKAVCAILRHGQVDAFITKANDVDGLYEAVARQADMVFMADDIRFAAIGLSVRATADNGVWTGAGFAEALLSAMGKYREKVLVLGASIVGEAAATHLLRKGIPVDIYDTDASVLARAALPYAGVTKLKNPPQLDKYKYLYDATTSANFITADDVSSDTIIAAPGMPCGITKEARRIATVIHNPLELGVLTMYFACARKMEAGKGECDS